MSVTRDQILEAAKAMTPAERYDLIEDLRQILDDDDELSPDQMAEVQRRIDSSARADGDRIASDEAIEALREKLRQRRRRRAS
jgi:hypothetical protein